MEATFHSVPLARQLQATAAVLAAVRAGASATLALQDVDAALRPGVQSLLFYVLRWLGQAEALRRKLAPRTPPPPADALLCTALALACRPEDALYEPFTLVDQTVDAAKAHPATRALAGFINACLRRFLREREALLQATENEPLAMWNHPRWWIDRLKREYPRRWQEILRTNNTRAPMTLRVNTARVTPDDYLRQLDDLDIEADRIGAQGIVLAEPRPVHDIPGFDAGLVSVQDAGAQLAAPLLLQGLQPERRPLRVLDACAAPGGKTAHLLELAAGNPAFGVTALDIDPERCARIHQTLDRLQLQARVIAADAASPDAWWPQVREDGLFDAILLDAPCTASGIVRRHPDVRWLRRESDAAQLAIIQAGLLATLWRYLKPGGRMLYCTCSVFQAEGVDQIKAFVAHNIDAVWKPSPGHLLPQTGPNRAAVPDNLPDHDGFFYALLEKRLA